MSEEPRLHRDALRRLRDLARDLHRPGSSKPIRRLVDLADARVGADVTVDVAASQELGEPMIVVRMPERPDPVLDVLSRREREVCALVAEGLANKEIAARLHLAVSTVKDHVHRILVKTGLPNRAAIAAKMTGTTDPG